MEYRTFGKTGRRVSVFTMGGMRFYRGGEQPADVYPDEAIDKSYKMVSGALSIGINLFETARGYCKSEGLMGYALKRAGKSRDSFQVMTKIVPIDDAGVFRGKLEESLRRLDIDKLDFFAFHGLNTERDYHRILRKGGCLDVIEQARSEGLVDFVGFSTHGTAGLILRTINTGAFDFVNLHYYRFRQTNRVAIEEAAQKNMGVLIISPNDKGGMLYNAPQALRDLTVPMQPAQHNEQWLLDHPRIHTLSIGASKPEHFKLHVEALKTRDGNQKQEIEARLNQAASCSVLRHCISCQACLPCPVGINIAETLRLKHLGEAYDMNHYVAERYLIMDGCNKWTNSAPGSACNDCGDCLPRCPHGLDIPKLLREFHVRYGSLKKWIMGWAVFVHSIISEKMANRIIRVLQFLRRQLRG